MEKQISLRIPEALYQRLMQLANDPPADLAARGSVKLSSVSRNALLVGVEAMEREKRKEGKGRQ